MREREGERNKGRKENNQGREEREGGGRERGELKMVLWF